MGYTVYAKLLKEPTKDQIKSFVARIHKLIAENSSVIQKEFDRDDAYNVNFNGIDNDSHETFTFYSPYTDSIAEYVLKSLDSDDQISRFDCVKTARKPYDEFVKLAYIIIDQEAPGCYKLMDDGENDETDPPGWRALVGDNGGFE